MIEPHELAQRHRLDILTPLLTISKAMLWGAEGMLLAGASQYAGLSVLTGFRCAARGLRAS
jgi:hypothetical protein